MAGKYKRLEITPDLLDFGSMIVRVGHIASVGKTEHRPLRLVGIPLIIVALALLGYESLFNPAAFSLKARGSTVLWAACGAFAVGLFCLVYAQRCLAIQLAGGARLLLRVGSQTFTDRLIYELRRAMTADAAMPMHIVVDLVEEEIAAGAVEEVDAHRFEPHSAQGPHSGAHPPHHHPQAQGPVFGPPQGPAHGPAGTHLNGNAHPHPHRGMNGMARGPELAPAGPLSHALPMQPAQHRGPNGQPVGQLNGAAPSLGPALQPGWQPHHLPGARPPPNGLGPVPHDPAPHYGPLHAGPPARAMPPPAARDILALIEFVGRSDIQHRDTLIELLKVVEDHEIGGRTSREDARAHWQSFTDYVGEYLGNVDGLPQLTERAAASLGGRL